MKPIKFKEQNVEFAKDQPQYTPLPAFRDISNKEGKIIFCMKLNFVEKIRILFTGRIWVSLLTFNKPLTPSYFTTRKSKIFSDG